MPTKKQENAIKSLANLYTVVIGLALSLSVVKLVDRPDRILAPSAAEVLLFVCLVFTLVPFYHGAMRHLDDAYLENTNAHIRDGALILDVLLLFIHGMVFVVLALLLSDPSQFAWTFVALITVDVIWGAFVHYGAATPRPGGAEGKWALINLVFVVVSAVLLYLFEVGLNPPTDATKLSLVIAVACMLRTLVDYYFCWKFYFPQD